MTATDDNSNPHDNPGGLDVGDRVTARHHLGGFLRPTVRRGTTGIITARDPNGTLHATFTNGRALVLDPTDVTLHQPT